MWIIATEDLTEFIPTSGSKSHHTQQDVCVNGLPRLFDNRTSAAIALGHWLNGPYHGRWDGDEEYGYMEITMDTDPNRKLIWEGKLAPREVKICPSV